FSIETGSLLRQCPAASRTGFSTSHSRLLARSLMRVLLRLAPRFSLEERMLRIGVWGYRPISGCFDGACPPAHTWFFMPIGGGRDLPRSGIAQLGIRPATSRYPTHQPIEQRAPPRGEMHHELAFSRQRLFQRRVLGTRDLHPDTFRPGSGNGIE